jgi:hypothetical protein
LPWHNFLSGPTTWDENDYEAYLDQMKVLNLNLIAFHCYTGGAERYATYVEPMIRIKYRNILPEAGFDTGITARGGYRPLLLDDYAFETRRMFPEEIKYFGSRVAVSAKTNEERYQKAQVLMRRVLVMAHARDIKFAMGFEFGVYPPEFASITPRGYNIPGTMLPDPTHYSAKEILQITIDDILRAYPGIDYIFLWLHEHTGLVGKAKIRGVFETLYKSKSEYFVDAENEDAIFTGVWAYEYILQAYQYLSKKAPDVKIVISGWGGGNQLPVVLQGLDRLLPKEIIFSCLNPDQGWRPQIKALAEITKNREVWGIPWLEGDQKLWHLQPRVALMTDHVRLAHQQKLDGMLAIHWRTEETRLNLEAFAACAEQENNVPTVKKLYQVYCERNYGVKPSADLVAYLLKMDEEQWLNEPDSPEYFPYTPGWGRISEALVIKLKDLIKIIQTDHDSASNVLHRQNLYRLLSNLKFTILLDQVSRKLEPAYGLKEKWFKEEIDQKVLAEEIIKVQNELNKAPLEELFDTFSNRNLSKGELGVLSSLNQKLWLQYKDLVIFVENLSSGNKSD